MMKLAALGAALSMMNLGGPMGMSGLGTMGGFKKPYNTRARATSRTENDPKHRKAMAGRKANRKRMQAIQRKGKTVYRRNLWRP